MKRISLFSLMLLSLITLSIQLYAADIVIRYADNLPDRNNGWGGVMAQVLQEFEKSHPGVKIEVETAQDQPYQDKMKIYASSDSLPDVFKYWTFSTLLKPLVDENLVVELNPKDYEKNGYIAGSLNSSMYGGKLYGLPASADFWVIYYNKSLFDKYKVKVPTTFDELFAAAEVFKKNGIVPICSDGKDSWPFSIMWDLLTERYSGDPTLPKQALDRKIKFTEPNFVKSAAMIQKMVKSGVFPADLTTSDYGASRNLFGQEKAAMYMMGGWESGLGGDQNFSENFRKNVRAAKFPVIKGEKGKIDDLQAWFGGNFVVNAHTKQKKLALELLAYISSRMPVVGWEKQAGFPAQKVLIKKEVTPVVGDLQSILADAKQTSGTPSLDLSTPQFKEDNQKFIQELLAGIVTPEEFCKKMDDAAEKAASK